MGICPPQERITSTRSDTVLRNDRRCKRIFMFPKHIQHNKVSVEIFSGMELSVCLVMLWTLHLVHQIHAAYPLERDLSQIAGVQSTKRWLVFIETRIWRCMRMVNPISQPHHDLLDFKRCFVVTKQTQQRCYRSFENHLTISGNRFHYRFTALSEYYPTCLPICPTTLLVLVHKMFNVNLTWVDFTVLDSVASPLQPFNCQPMNLKITITFNYCSYVCCGSKYPWSTFVDSNSVFVELPHCIQGKYDVMAEVGIMDRQHLPGWCGPDVRGLVIWDNFETQTYQISVEMLYQIFITLIASSHQLQTIVIYYGPNPNMPKLLPSKQFPQKAHYTPSTFQALIFVLSQRNSSIKVIYDSHSDREPLKFTPTQMLYVRNNTGCGNNNDKSWMCILDIVAPRDTYARLKIADLSVTGSYASLWESAGIVIYNVINNTIVLVAHLATSMDKYMTVTGTERQLLVSLYGYSPFAILSVTLMAETSFCVGQFILEYKQPCTEMLLGHHNNVQLIRLRCIGGFYKAFNVSHQCLAFQNTISPYRYFALKTFRSLIHFRYNSQLKIEYNSTSRCHVLRLFGKYEYIRGNQDQKSYSAMGDIHHVSFESWPFYCGYRDLVFVTVSETSCMQPCHDINVVMPYQYGVPTCDICKYFWLDGSRTPSWYHSIPNKTVTLERLRGEPVATVWISSEADVRAGGHILSYNLSQFTHRFEKKRMFRVEMTAGSLWRVHKDVLSMIYLMEGGSSGLGPRGEFDIGVLKRRGSYEYTIVSNMQGRNYPIAYDFWCGLHGASLLTIHDDQELRFVVDKIMQPLKI